MLIRIKIKASINGNIELVKLLLSYDADVDSRGRKASTALMWGMSYYFFIIKFIWNVFAIKACSSDKLDIVKLLIENNADINSRDNDEWTPLMWGIVNNLNKN